MKRGQKLADTRSIFQHHPLKMRVPIEAGSTTPSSSLISVHHPLKMRVPIEAFMALSIVKTK